MKQKSYKKFIACMLAFVIVFTSFRWDGIIAMAAEQQEQTAEVSMDSKEVIYLSPEEVTKEHVIEDEMEADRTIYDLGGSKRMEVIHGGDVRFKDENNQWVDYDPALVTVEEKVTELGSSLEGYAYTNHKGDKRNYLPERLKKDTPVRLENENYGISFHPVMSDIEEENAFYHAGDFEKAVLEEESYTNAYEEESMQPLIALYENESGNMAIEYQSLDIGVKENIILNEVPDQNSFVFEFKLEGTTVRHNALDEGLTFYNEETEDIIAGMDAPNMNDATGEAYSEALTTKVEEKEGEEDTYIITITADVEYLTSEDRVYPVTIDPTVTWTGTSQLKDVYICSGSTYKDINFYDSGIKCMSIGDSAQGVYRTYMKIIDLSTYVKGYYVESATLKLWETDASYSGETVNFYRVKESWTTTEITWNTRASHTTSKCYGSFESTGVGSTKTVDLTEYARDVANKSITNYGLVMRAGDESSDGKYVQLANERFATTSKRPKLTVVYYDPPATPTLTLNSPHIQPGETLTVSWSDLTSRSLDYVQYRVAKYDKENQCEIEDLIPYSSSTIIGTESSGTAKLTDSKNWPEGYYKLAVRGVDTAGIKGDGRGKFFNIDGTPPTLSSVSITPATSSSAYTTNESPVIQWSGAVDKYLSRVVYSINGGDKQTAGTTESGSVTVTGITDSGKYTIKVWALDKAGNSSPVKTFYYYRDAVSPAVQTLSLTAATSASNGYTKENTVTVNASGITEAHSGLASSGVSYAVVSSGASAPDSSAYQQPSSVTFTASSNPYALHFPISLSGKSTGTYTIYLNTTDKAGNVSTKTLSAKRDVTTPSGTISVTGNSVTALPEVKDTINIDITVSDSHSGIKKASLVLLNAGGVQVGDALISNATASTGVSYNTETLDNGNYTLKLTVEDGAGNSNSVTKEITVANQMDAPNMLEGYTNTSTAVCRWEFASAPKNLKEIQYQLPGSTQWIGIPDSAKQTGEAEITLPEAEGIYQVKFRGIDTADVAGVETEARYVVDKTSPTIMLDSFKQGVLNGTVKDDYIKEWQVSICQKNAVSEEVVATNSENYENEQLAAINITDNSKYPAGQWYEIKVTALDMAGNTAEEDISFYKAAENQTEGVPLFEIKTPDGMEEEDIWYLSGEESFEIQKTEENTTDIEISSVAWYLDGIKDTENSSNVYSGDFSDAAKFEEGKNYTILALIKGTDGKEYLTGDTGSRTYTEQTEITTDGIRMLADLCLSEQVERFTFHTQEVKEDGQTITYEMKLGDGEWMTLEPEKEYVIREIQNLITTERIRIKTSVSGGAQITSFTLDYNTVKEQDFVVSLFEQYRPRNVSAQDKIDYKTYVKWDILAKGENNEDITLIQVNEAAELARISSGKVTYELYRGTEKNFVADADHLLASDIETNYWSSIDVETTDPDYEKTYYYKLRAVEKDEEGNIVRASHFSNIAESTVIADNEYAKRLGFQEYWGYTEFNTPNGDGAVELSQGNFYYSQDDISLPNAKLEFGISRYYNSQSTVKTAFGRGWDHNYNLELLKIFTAGSEDNAMMIFKDSTGTIYRFVKEENSETDYYSQANEYVTLKVNEGNVTETKSVIVKNDDAGTEETIEIGYVYTLTTKDGAIYLFDGMGRLVYEEEPNGTFLRFVYDDYRGFLVTVITHKGKELGLTYHTEDEGDCALVKQILLPDGTSLNYEYIHEETEVHERNYRLSAVTRKGTEENETVTYQYGYNEDWLLGTLYDAVGNEYQLEYEEGEDGLVRVTSMTDPIDEMLTIEYESSSNKTSTTKKNASEMELYTTSVMYNGEGYVIEETDADDLKTTMVYVNGVVTEETAPVGYQSYDSSTGKVVFHTEEKTNVTEYGSRNNPERETDALGNVILYSYEDENVTLANQDLPVSETETGEDGLIISDYDYEYDDYGNETYSIDHIEEVETYSEYDSDGNLLKDTTYSYDISSDGTVSSNKTKVSETEYEYDEEGNPLTEKTTTPESSATTTNTYDSMGRTTKTVTVCGDTTETTETTYDYLGREISTVTSTINNGKSKTQTTSMSYDDNGTLLREAAIDGTVTTYSYDDLNRLTQRTVSNGGLTRTYTTEYGYEANLTISQGGSTTKTIPVAYKEVQKQGEKILSTTYKDGAGRTIREIASGITTDYIYDSVGNQVGTVSAGKTTIQIHDAAGNVTEVIMNPEVTVENGVTSYSTGEKSVVTSSTYDSRGNVTSETDPMGVTTLYTYDEADGSLSSVKVKDTEGTTTVGTYTTVVEGGGTTTTLTDALGKMSRTISDSEGKQTAVLDLDGENHKIQTSYSYNSDGSLYGTTFEDGSYLSYTYTATGQTEEVKKYKMSGEEAVLIGVTRYTYDPDTDTVLTMKDYLVEDGKETPLRYTGYEYDSFGRNTAYIEVDGTDSPTEEQKIAGKVSYTYDSSDQLIRVDYPESSDTLGGMSFTYNDHGWLMTINKVESGTASLLREYDYNSDGTVKAMKDYTGLDSNYILKNYSYDELGRVISILSTKNGAASDILESYAYSYDKNGNILIETIVNNTPATTSEKVDETRTHTYDSFGRLLKTEYVDRVNTSESRTVEYTYDAAGNRLTQKEGTETTAYTYNGLHQLVSSVTTDSSQENAEISNREYTYDANGNEISETDSIAGTAVIFDYDTENQMVKSVLKQSDIVVSTQENWYNGNGQRIGKEEVTGKNTETPVAETTHYFYDDTVVLYTKDEEGNLTSKNLLGLADNAIATKRYDGESGSELYFYLKDIRGSVSSIVDESMTGVVSYEYDDFGITTEYGDTEFENQICYTGGIYDELTGLYYLNARYYDPETGRFLTEDTYRGEMDDFDTWHLYAYCANNPVNYTDPSGHVPQALAIRLAAKGFVSIITYVGVSSVASIMGGLVLLGGFAYVSVKVKQQLQKEIVKLGTRITLKTAQKAINRADAKARALPRLRKYGKRKEKHHIVPKGVKRYPQAVHARKLLEKIGMDVKKDSRNQVLILKSLHVGLHTKMYYTGVDNYLSNGAMNRRAILSRLKHLKYALLALSNTLEKY